MPSPGAGLYYLNDGETRSEKAAYAIPKIDPWRGRGIRAQRWTPTLTLAEAQELGAFFARTGVKGNMTAGWPAGRGTQEAKG